MGYSQGGCALGWGGLCMASGSFFDATTLSKAHEGDAFMLRCVCVVGEGAWWMCVRPGMPAGGMGPVCRVVCMTACA